MIKKKLISLMLAASMLLSSATPAFAYSNEGKDTFVAKPLVILMDFPDYKYTEIQDKEDWTVNDYNGADTTPEFYKKLFFGDNTYQASTGERITANKFFKEVSGNSYSIKGDVFGWYTAKNDAVTYGSTQADAGELVKEGLQALAADKPNLDWSKYDVEDKWDLDNDGDFNEPDGIIDCVVLIHAGVGEEFGGGSLGEDAIWPFRIGFSWFEDLKPEIGDKEFMEKDKNGNTLGAYTFDIGGGKKFVAEDFVVFEQDLPLDLFCHEYGHNLGLPDLYATGNGGTPPVENWSLMGGSYSGNPQGSQMVGYGAWCEKWLQADFEMRNRKANWQNETELTFGDLTLGTTVELDASTKNNGNTDSVYIELPEIDNDMKISLLEGSNYLYYSNAVDEMKTFMTTKELIDLTAVEGDIKLSFDALWNIDPMFDYACVQVKPENANEWDTLQDTTGFTTDEFDEWLLSQDNRDNFETDDERDADLKDRNPGWGITGSSKNEFKNLEFDLSKYKGEKISLRFRFRTDSNTPEDGIYIDNILITETESSAPISDTTTGDTTTGDTTTGDTTTGDATTGDTTTGDTTTGDTNTGDTTTGDATTGDATTGDTNTGDTNTGDTNNEETKQEEGQKADKGEAQVQSTDKIIFSDDGEDEELCMFEFITNRKTGFERNDGYYAPYKQSYVVEWRAIPDGEHVDKGLENPNRWDNEDGNKMVYNPGMLVWFVNDKYYGDYPDQGINNHPGEVFCGLADANREPVTYDYFNYTDEEWPEHMGTDRAQYQLNDAAFSLRKGETLKIEGSGRWGDYVVEDTDPYMNPIFADTDYYDYYVDPNSNFDGYDYDYAVLMPDYGIRMFLVEESADKSSAKIHFALADGDKTEQENDIISQIAVSGKVVNITPNKSADISGEAYIQVSYPDGANYVSELVENNGVFTAGFENSLEDAVIDYVIFNGSDSSVKAIYNIESNGVFGAKFSELFKCENTGVIHRPIKPSTGNIYVRNNKTTVPTKPVEVKSSNVNSNGDIIIEELRKSLNTNIETINIRNGRNLPKSAIDFLVKNKKSITADTTLNNKIVGRIYLNPQDMEKITSDFKLFISPDSDSVKFVKNKFRFFKNEMVFVHMEQKGDLGFNMNVAVKVDLSKLNKDNLIFYAYNAETNTYKQLKDNEYFIDSNGFLHFTTNIGGDIVITDSPLELK